MVRRERGRVVFPDRLEIPNTGRFVSRTALTIRCINKTGGPLAAGLPVQVDGDDATSGLPKVKAANAAAAGTLPAAGLLADVAANNAEVDLVYFGVATTALDTSLSAIGAPVYVADGGGLGLVQGTVRDVIGQVHSLAVAGKVFVNPKQVE